MAGADKVLNAAASVIGTPYSWGGGNDTGATKGIDQGAGTVGFDCSGLVQFAYHQAGLNLDGTAADMQRHTTLTSSPKPGDLVFYGDPAHHVAIYAGAGKQIAAPHTGDVIKVQDVYGGATYRHFKGLTFADNPLEWTQQHLSDAAKGLLKSGTSAASSAADSVAGSVVGAATAAVGAALAPAKKALFIGGAVALGGGLILAGGFALARGEQKTIVSSATGGLIS